MRCTISGVITPHYLQHRTLTTEAQGNRSPRAETGVGKRPWPCLAEYPVGIGGIHEYGSGLSLVRVGWRVLSDAEQVSLRVFHRRPLHVGVLVSDAP